MTEKSAGVVDSGNLASGADAGVYSKYGELARGRGEQQIPEILTENLDGIGVGALFEFEPDLPGNGTTEQALPGVFRREVQLGILLLMRASGRCGSSSMRKLRTFSVSPRRIASIRWEGICRTGSR